MSRTAETFNRRLKTIMKFYKLKNTDIAKAVGKDSQTIWNYFHNKSKPPWTDSCNLIQYLQDHIGKRLDLNYLFGNTEDNDMLQTVEKLQKELRSLKADYDELLIKYISKNNPKVQKNLYKTSKKEI